MRWLPRCLILIAPLALALVAVAPAQEKKKPEWPHVNTALA